MRKYESNDLLTKGEVAAYLRVTERTVNLWMNRGIIKFVRMQTGRVRFRYLDVQRFLDVQMDGPKAEHDPSLG